MKKRNALSITAILFSITMFALVACSGNGTNDTPKKLIMTSLSYNDTSKVVSWSAVANAQRFELSLVGQGIEREATITAKNNATNKYEYMKYVLLL